MKKPVLGGLSGMDFLLAHTSRQLQRWRDGEGAFGHAGTMTPPRSTKGISAFNNPVQRQQPNRQDKLAQPTEQQKAKGRRFTSPVLLPLTEGDGI